MLSNEIYLSREGEVFGPYTTEQLDELRRTGEFIKFAWLWDGSTPDWVTANPPPPLPQRKPTPPPGPAALKVDITRFRVICHDFQALLSCRLASATVTGCRLIALSAPAGLPAMRKDRKVWLGILDERSGTVENVAAVIQETKRVEGGTWEYQVSWEKQPELLSG